MASYRRGYGIEKKDEEEIFLPNIPIQSRWKVAHPKGAQETVAEHNCIAAEAGPLISHDFPLEGKQNWLWLLIFSSIETEQIVTLSFLFLE